MMTFNGLLDSWTLQQLQRCFQQPSVNRFALQNSTIGFGVDPISIACNGKFCVIFYYSDRSSVHLEFTSLYDEINIPLPEHGKLNVAVRTEIWQPLSEKIKKNSPDVYDYHSFISYPEMSPIISIKFYGNCIDDYLNKIDPDIDIKYLQEKYGLNEFPKVICNSIEFVVFGHENDRKTILVLQDGMFQVRFYEYIVDLMATLNMYNYYGKNIVLQQEVGQSGP